MKRLEYHQPVWMRMGYYFKCRKNSGTNVYKQNNSNLSLLFSGQRIPSVTSHKHLELTFSTDLHFHKHVSSIIKTVNYHLGPVYPIVPTFLSRCAESLDYDIDHTLTIVTSFTTETYLVWLCTTNLTKSLCKTGYWSLSSDINWCTTQRLGLGTTGRQTTHTQTDIFHRLYYNGPPLPTYLTNLITYTRQDATGLRLRHAQLLSVPTNRLTSFRKSFLFPPPFVNGILLHVEWAPETVHPIKGRRKMSP